MAVSTRICNRPGARAVGSLDLFSNSPELSAKILSMQYLVLSLSILLSFSAHTFELVIIQAVANSKKTFVTKAGKKDGVYPGQKATFTTEDISIAAEAEAVTREYAVWRIRDEGSIVPFKKNQIVEYNNSLESVYYNLRLLEKKVAPPKIERNALIFKGNYVYTLNESVSGVAEQQTIRQANQLEFLYQIPIYTYLYGAIGFRYDNEVLDTDDFTINSKRYMGIVDLAFHIPKFQAINANFYVAGGFGYGTSKTSIGDIDSTGSVSVLPYVRTGLQFGFGLREKYNLLVEGGVESLHANETIGDTGVEQTTDLTSAKFALGLKIKLDP